jgi:pimeloyl-[acyl-carrier protein] methyl ester esterase
MKTPGGAFQARGVPLSTAGAPPAGRSAAPAEAPGTRRPAPSSGAPGIAVRTVGTGREPVVLIHGWGFNSSVWGAIGEGLSPRYRAYLVDLPGHGASPTPPPGLSLAAAATVVAAAVPERATWLGWSLGGLLALAVAESHPSSVERLLLVATTPRFLRGPDWPHAVAPETLAAFAEDLERDVAGTLARFIALQVRGIPDATRAARALRTALQTAGLPGTDALALGLGWLRDSDLRGALPGLACPGRWLLGERDTLVPAAVLDDLRRLRPDWPGEVIRGAGHAPFATDPPGFIRHALGEASRGG